VRRLLAALAATAAALVAGSLGGCAKSAAQAGHNWHDGRLYIATGNTTGVFYVLGGGYADLISRYMPGWDAHAEPTSASVENLKRVDSGDMELGLTLADSAADAVSGRGSFEGRPQRIVALARIYTNYTHVLVRTSAKIRTVADLRGKKVSTGSPNSGTEVIALRMLSAAGLDPDRDVARQKLSLAETTSAIKAGSIDAMFWSGGLPTPGISDMMSQAPGQFAFLPVTDLIEPLNAKFGNIYTSVKLPKNVYNTPADIATLGTPNLLFASPDMPEALAYRLTKLLFEHQEELAKAHPEGKNFDRTIGRQTGSVPLHPGAQRFYETG
jgi:TRAP transporter TAXI family solute receptor